VQGLWLASLFIINVIAKPSVEKSVGAEAICPSIWQIASLHCVPFAMTVTMGRLLRSVALHSQ